MDSSIELHIAGRRADVWLARDSRRNSFDTAMLAAMEEVLHALSRARDVDVVVLRARGAAFCAGTDLKELAKLDASATLHWQRRTGELVERWNRLDATTLTAFQGAAIGSGAIVGLASDLRIASSQAWFQFPEIGYGIPLTWSGIQILVDLVGADRAKQILLLQQRLDAAALQSSGMVMEVVEPASLDARCEALVQQLLDAPALARAMTKRAVAAAAAAPGFVTSQLDPFLASLSIHERQAQGSTHYGKVRE